MSMNWLRTGMPVGLVMVLAGCAGSPVSPRTEAKDTPAQWQAQAMDGTANAVVGPWRIAQPVDAQDKGAWWLVFGDERLNALQQQALSGSPTLQAAVARLRQAHDLVDISGAASLPRVDAAFKDTRTRTSANRPSTTSSTQAVSSIQNDFVFNGTVSYELDLFGRVRYDQEAARATEQQAQADLVNARLVLSADLSTYYFGVRSLDAEIDVLQQGLQSQLKAAALLQIRHEGGVASRLDVAQQQAQVDATRTQLTLLDKQRAQQVHALATLVGQPVSTFTLDVQPLPLALPIVPVGLPSDVLQRRPDVASAERAVAAANALVGVAESAWFPSIALSASGGWESKDIARLIEAPSLLWAVGGSVAQTVFDGGRTRAREDQARAGHELTLASYRQTVLRALQEVEDGLSSLNTLSVAYRQSQDAVSSAQKVLDIAQDRYAGGLSTYLDVVTAQQNVLNSQRLSSQLRGQQLQSTTYLIKALGGGWLTATQDRTAY